MGQEITFVHHPNNDKSILVTCGQLLVVFIPSHNLYCTYVKIFCSVIVHLGSIIPKEFQESELSSVLCGLNANSFAKKLHSFQYLGNHITDMDYLGGFQH